MLPSPSAVAGIWAAKSSAPPSAVSHGAAATWNVAGGGSWADSGNWLLGAIPNSAVANARFGEAITGPATITIDSAKTVKVQAYNLKGELYEMVCNDLPARVWQHEIDHLDGVLFIDKMGSLGLNRSQKDLDKFIADFEKEKKKGDLPADLIPKL